MSDELKFVHSKTGWTRSMGGDPGRRPRSPRHQPPPSFDVTPDLRPKHFVAASVACTTTTTRGLGLSTRYSKTSAELVRVFASTGNTQSGDALW